MKEALHAEWTRQRTVAATGWLLLATAVLTCALSLASAAAAQCPVVGCGQGPARVSLTGVEAGQGVVAILAVLAISGEYSTGMIRTTLTATPLSLTDGPVLRAVAGSVLYLVLIALLSLGVATAVREPAVAIGVVLALLYLFPVIAHVAVNQQWYRHLEQTGPMTAGLAIQA
ncbi:MAG TPA: ABC transporter permease, partial [Streptosporangiaceae bacterium]|nr:ABC transporter permease [Streptosporangiaceae bacterium]